MGAAGHRSLFEEIGREVAPTIGGLPIQLRLLNTQHELKKESTVGSAIFAGEDTVYYLGTATAFEAQALGQSFKSLDFFQGKGADVFLSKHSDGTMLSFVVGDGVWNNPALVGDFEKIVRHTGARCRRPSHQASTGRHLASS